MTQISIIGRNYYIDPSNPSPKLSRNAGGYTYIPTVPRVMYTIAQPNIEYEFSVPPTQFEMEGFGAEINEIKRPYSLPIADIYGGKLRRLSFEFAVLRFVRVDNNTGGPNYPTWSYYDGMTNSVEDQIERIQLIADTGIPVGFENFSGQIMAYSWLIDDMKWTFNRDSGVGNTVAATCTMSLIEYRPARQRFILMPRFAYGVPSAGVKAGAKNVTGAEKNAAQLFLKPLFEKKVFNRVSLGQITYPFTRDALQALLNSTAAAANKGSFVIPEAWITEIKTKYKPAS